VHSRGDDVFPIPGTKRRAYLEENAAAFDIELTDEEHEALEEAAAEVAGERYEPAGMKSVER
jgi:aryl-alcohol dehydrogenase-like predicted oxidoreductase